MTKQNKKPNGYIIYEGASLLDGKPIVVVALTGSRNQKTGDMIQTVIIRSDIDPITASKSGEDFSICGNCPLRGEAHNDPKRKTAKNRACYVVLAHLPLTVYKQYKKGAYPKLLGHEAISELGKDAMIRVGTYGDPSAVNSYIWDSLLERSKGHTAYSHQANLPQADYRPDLFMRSADNAKEAVKAWAKGERTFRIVKDVKEMIKGKEIICPNETKGVSCIDCKLCKGASLAKSIVITAHGMGASYV